jgi:hypothetical protein
MALEVKQNAIGRQFDIPWVGGSIYHGFFGDIQNTIGMQFAIPWIGGSLYLGFGGSYKIPQPGSLIYHG